jgi:sigma-E factor negative regulatory protein RseC
MLTEVGRVVGVESDGLWVETIRRTTCGTCAAQKGCGHGLLNKISDGKRGYIRVLPGEQRIADYSVDDQVLFSIPEEAILRGSFIAYILPLATMLGGALVMSNVFPGGQDTLAALGAVAGLALGFALVRWHGARHRHDRAFQPVLLSPAPPDAEPVTFL